VKQIDWSRFWAVLRLGWKLSRRRWERQSPLLGGIAVVLMVLGVATAIGALFAAFLLGVAFLPGVSGMGVLYTWDVVLVGFLVAWLFGLLINVQLGGESITLTKLLHTPISPAGAFLLNFLGSLVRVSMVIFLSIMLGLTAASVVVFGPESLMLVPLVLAIVTMVGALTYQFQSWLARLIANKRRRSTVVAVAVLGFVVLANIPNILFNVVGPQFDVVWEDRWTVIANLVFPPGWVALGAWTASQDQLWPCALAIIGLFGIAALSLRRSYGKMLASLALDEGSSDRARTLPPPRDAAASRKAAKPAELRDPNPLVERLVGRLPEQSRAVAWVSMRLWMRSPQGKLVILSPLFVVVLLFLVFPPMDMGGYLDYYLAMLMIGIVITMAFNLFANLFGQDGNGFRAVVIVGASPRNLILGKNLALAPFVLVIAGVAVGILQWISPLPLAHLLAHVVQVVILFLVGCLLGNSFSIRNPWPMSSTSVSMRNSSASMFLATILILIIYLLMPLPPMLALAIERAVHEAGVVIPVYLVFTILELALVYWIYGWILKGQGRLLEERIHRVLDRVTEPVD